MRVVGVPKAGVKPAPCPRDTTCGDFLVVIRINGKDSEVATDISVAQLLEDLELRPGRVVVEVNAEVLSRDAHGGTHLKQGDEVEIVQFVGGG